MKIYHKNESKRNLLKLTESAVLVLKINNGFWVGHLYDSVHVLLLKFFLLERRAKKGQESNLRLLVGMVLSGFKWSYPDCFFG